MDYERIQKPQVGGGGFSPGKLRSMLLGVEKKRKENEDTESAFTLRSQPPDFDDQAGGGASDNCKDVDVVSVHPKCSTLNAADSLGPEMGSDQRLKDSTLVNSRIRSQEDPSLDYGSGCDAMSVSASMFEFQKAECAPQRVPLAPFSKPAPSKWDDAQKWIASPTWNRPKMGQVQMQGGQGVGLQKVGSFGYGSGQSSCSTKVVVEVPDQKVDIFEEPDTKRIDTSQPKTANGGQKCVSWEPDPYPIADSYGKSVLMVENSVGESAINLSQHDSSTAFHGTTIFIPPPSTARSVSMRDMGTEMTPIASQEPSRTGTPVGATTPIRSPNDSSPSTPSRAAPTSSPIDQNTNKELSEKELQLKTRKEIMVLGTQLGKMNIAAWASKEEDKDASASQKTVLEEQPGTSVIETRAAAWEESEKAKYMARFKREEMKIQAWENHQKAKTEAEMRKIEVEVERIRGRAHCKLMNKLAAARHKAQEKRAAAEAKRNRQAAKAEHQAEYIRKTGRIPSSFWCWAEEEALKRNTDCVYFLASPLTCKKGSECEYRHSEYARVNPRDCWYWLNGSCLNLKCAFRHPPLDGLLGSPAANSAGPSLPLSHPGVTPTAPATHAAYNPSKQAVPCIFFQKGQCLKGEKCAFSHGPNPMASSKFLQTPAPHGTEPSGLKKAFGGLQKCIQELKVPKASVAKSVGVPPEAKPAPKILTAPIRNGVSIERNVQSTKALDDEALRYKATSVPPVINGGSTSRANHLPQVHVSDYHGFQNVKDVDEHLRESSPGFDVLVDDELGDSDYYHGEDRYGRTRGHEGRNLNSVNEYDLDRPVDYTSMADVDRERFCDPRGYDPYDRMQGQYAWDQHRASSERQLVGPARLERRGYRKSESPENIDELDLRHRLSKHRRVNGLRSIVSHDYAVDGHVEERNNRPLRDSQQLPPHEGSRSSRLHGRIKLPGGSSPVNGSDLHQEREVDRARSQGRLSPRRPQISSHQGRLRDRIKGRVEEDYDNERRNFGAPLVRREIMDDRGDDFSRPKRLPDLKVVKDAENKEQSYLGKRKSVMDNNNQAVGDLSFEGPKPLSEILKRKREAEAAAASGSRKSSAHDKRGNNQRESRESNQGNSQTAVTETNNSLPPAAKEEPKFAMADAVGTEDEKVDVAPGQSSEGHEVGEVEAEEGMIYEENEIEGDDQREGEYDYEQGDEGDYNYEEGENAEGEEEYLEEDEDGDDFAKKIGVMFS
ncbi:hypothetical protein ACFX2I_010773 [Malus domestica]